MKKIMFCAALLAASLSVTSAHAQEKYGFYVSPEVGLVKIKDYCAVGDLPLRVTKCDDAKPGFGLSGGYRFNDYIAVEGGYRIANGFKATGIVTATRDGYTQGNTFSITADLSSFSLGLRGFIPLTERLSITPSAGYHFWEQDFDNAVNNAALTVDGSDLYLGLGAEFSVSADVGVRVSYSRFFGDDADTDIIGANVVIRF